MRLILAVCLAVCVIQGATLAIRDITVIDIVRDSAEPHQTILVRNGRIAAGPAHAIRIPDRAKVVNGRGKYAIPGLWDMHVHLWDKENVLPRYVAWGVTGVRDMGSDLARTRKWRSEIDSGKAMGPQVVTCGPALNGRPSENPKLPVVVIATPEEARREIDRLDAQKVDFIKVLSDVPREAYLALAERSRHWGTPFAGHIPNGVTLEEAIEARQASLEHMFNFPPKDEARLRSAFERCALLGIRVTPTLTLWDRMAREDAKVADSVPAVNALVRLAARTGAPLLAGTDTGDPGTEPGHTLHEELELLVKAGLSPAEALRSATTEPARFLERADSMGQLKCGMRADIVLLGGNPLMDISNTRRIEAVVVRGRYLDKPALRKLVP